MSTTTPRDNQSQNNGNGAAPKPTAQETAEDIADLMNSGRQGAGRLAQCIFDGAEFPHKFWVHEVERGKLRIYEELPGRVVRYVEERAVVDAIVRFGRTLPADPAFKHYRFTKRKAEEIKDYWMCCHESRFPYDVKPVLQKTTDGWTSHRLDFDMAPIPTPLFDSFCGHMLPECVEPFKAFIGMLFDPAAPRQQYLWIYGPGGDGKGTFLNLLKRIFGKSYSVAIASRFLGQDKFLTSRFVDARVGVFPDCQNPKFVRDETFMMLTGGDAMPIERKGKDVVTMELPTLFIISSNSAPDITGSEAHRRRAIIAALRKREDLDGDPATYLERLWEERAGILWQCWEAWQCHKAKYGRVKGADVTVDDAVEEAEERWRSTVAEYFVVKHDAAPTITPETLYNIMAHDANFTPQDFKYFKAYLSRLGVTVKREDAFAARMVHGLHLRSDREYQTSRRRHLRAITADDSRAPTF